MPLKRRFDELRVITPGLYRHYKGGIYRVLFVARHSETAESFIVYKAVHGKQTWARPLKMFCGEVYANGAWQPRFVLISGRPERSAVSPPRQLELFAA